MLENIEEKVRKMPLPKVIQVSNTSQLALTLNENYRLALTLSWQQVLAKISEALIAGNTVQVLKLLFSELDYIQLNHNAVNDICNLVRQPVDQNALIEIEAKLNLLKNLINEYLKHPQTNVPLLNYLSNEFSFVVQQLKNLGVVGVGAFMLTSGLRLALLQAQAASDHTVWSRIRDRAIEDSDYAFNVTPQLFRLTVGQIDKACQCSRWKSAPQQEQSITQYECRYFDGKDIHIFRAINPDAGFKCNKHRLLMFQTVVDQVNQTAATPVRTALKKWRKLAAQIQKNHSTTDQLTRRVLASAD
jgi:hypothetical protein